MVNSKRVVQKKGKSKKEIKFKLRSDAVVATPALKRITGRRSTAYFLCDALRSYMWIIFEQTYGGIIASLHEDGKSDSELVSYVRNQKFAEKYFKQMGWVR